LIGFLFYYFAKLLKLQIKKFKEKNKIGNLHICENMQK